MSYAHLQGSLWGMSYAHLQGSLWGIHYAQLYHHKLDIYDFIILTLSCITVF